MTLDQKNNKTLRHSGENNNSPRGGFEEHRSTDTAQRLDCAVIALFDFLIIHIWTRSCSLCIVCAVLSIHRPFSFLRSQTFLLPFVCGSIISLQQPHTHTQIIFKEPSQPGKAFPTYIRQAIDCDEIIFWQPPPHLRSRSPLWRGFWI
jgi:hypothetical protein